MDIRLEVSEKLKGLTGVSFSPEDGVYEFIEIPQLVARTEYGIFTLYGGYGLIFGNRIGGSQAAQPFTTTFILLRNIQNYTHVLTRRSKL